jgi:hypothetical protein
MDETGPRTEAALDALRQRIEALTVTTDGLTLAGPWHPVESGDPAAYGFWLDDAEGNSSFPDPSDVAAFLNAMPGLLRIEAAARAWLAADQAFIEADFGADEEEQAVAHVAKDELRASLRLGDSE